ncbi:MAG: DMT family transporter [Lachnospiraceae bacterium]|nr:DMT family transporter [Lachnospiraceae bacterium]
MWFVCALISTIAWGVADLFYKKGADEKDRFSHLKTSMIVGFVMGGHAIATLIITGVDYDPVNLVKYFPVSAMYILSMTVGYFGLRYLELSISSPIQNSSGAVTCILCLVLLNQMMDGISAAGVIIICAGVFFLGVLEKREIDKARDIAGATGSESDKKYRIGLVAFFMPILYCIIDALGTFFDAYYLDDFEATPLVGVTEDTLETVANVSYELTFLICGVILLIYMILANRSAGGRKTAAADAEGNGVSGKNDMNVNDPREYGLDAADNRKRTVSRVLAAVFETAGQMTYVYAMSGNGVVAAPMIASYSIVSLILSRVFLKEKLTKLQYMAVTAVIIGIALLGLAEGLAE